MQTWWTSPNQLDEDQVAIMKLPPDGSYGIKGPPGSGKTNLLLMRAAYLTSLHKNILILVLNRNLAEFIRSGANAYGLDSQSVLTSRSFVGTLAREAGIVLTRSNSYEASRAETLAILQDIRARTGGPIYDAFLIDEAQDHSIEELLAMRALTHDLFLTSDSRQMIYDGGIASDSLAQIVDEVKSLRYHYRSSPEICDLADSIGQTFSTGYQKISPTSRYPRDAPNEPVRVEEGSLQRQAELIAERATRQARAYRGQLIGVIAPRRDDVSAIIGYLRSMGLDSMMTIQDNDEGFLPLDPRRPIFVSTVHGAKGLEFQAVHFAAADSVKFCGAIQKRLAFTAVTRAKSALAVYHSDKLPGYLDAALAPYRGTQELNDWTGIFDA